jgi:hypothetical protein
MSERMTTVLKLFASHVGLISGITAATFIMKQNSFLSLLIAQTSLFILYFTGYWEFFGSGLKTGFLLVIEILLIVSAFIRIIGGGFSPIAPILTILSGLLEFYLLFVLIKILMVIFREEKESVEIVFPFRDGIYLVTDGGNSRISRMMNYHFHSGIHRQKMTHGSMLHATDLVKLSLGKFKFMPLKNEDYPVYNQEVFCPMEGKVIKVINNMDDNGPFSGDYPYNTGNTVVLRNNNYYLLLGHLKKGSIVVREGETVNKNELIGRAGNSGMSERPHLHMQLMRSKEDNYWFGKGISMTYKGRNLYKNRRIKIK